MTSAATREAALLKMSRFNVKIGYPDEWIDYSPLNFGPEGNNAPFLTMVFAQKQFHSKR